MTQTTQQKIDDLFESIKARLEGSNSKALAYLKNMQPSHGEHERSEWRYRLSGYLEGLCTTNQIDDGFIEQLVAVLFSRAEPLQAERPGRAHAFSVDIATEQQRKVFSFDVPSMNPLDAYVQLNKRTAYKSIPDIETIKVYAGTKKDRKLGAAPLRIFQEEEFIFIR
jgi:hypothetical protein